MVGILELSLELPSKVVLVSFKRWIFGFSRWGKLKPREEQRVDLDLGKKER